jgi:Zn ribbon nucleic-acid-binding protein
MSKEMKLLRSARSWQEKRRSALLCVRCGKTKKAIHKRVKDILFTRKDFLTTAIGQVSW